MKKESTKYFIPKSMEITPEVKQQLLNQFPFLNDAAIEIIDYGWDGAPCWKGVVVVTDKKTRDEQLFPYDRTENEFLREYPEGEIWKPNI